MKSLSLEMWYRCTICEHVYELTSACVVVQYRQLISPTATGGRGIPWVGNGLAGSWGISSPLALHWYGLHWYGSSSA